MKIVREHIIFEKFVEDSDPVKDLGIGMEQIVKKWYETKFGFSYDTKERALIPAAAWGELELVEALIGMGVNVNYVDNNGFTPLYCAAVGAAEERDGKNDAYKKIVELLLNSGANPNVINDKNSHFETRNIAQSYIDKITKKKS